MSSRRSFVPLLRCVRLAALLWLVGMVAGCGGAPAATQTASTPGATCSPNDQDQYVYDPTRLQVLQACIRVTGTVDGMWVATDGDTNLLLRLDPPYQHLLTPGNEEGEERGDLGVEAVCTVSPVDPIVMALCANDRDPYAQPAPRLGAHVWMEGRYILDLNHGSHAELHPLYRMGTLSG
ncbi:MAG TPA: hypothetical protein VGN32_12135 [Ktedonobacterales bacterium]|jgi:hypothetical protein|nr:hypothetical protein [Ktedonobacterales bacterium]